MTRGRRWWVALLAVLALRENGWAVRPPFIRQHVERGFAVAPDVALRLYLPAGRIAVRTWSRDSIAMSGDLGRNAAMFGGGDRTHVKLGVEALRTADPDLPQASLIVHVPRNARIWIKTIDAELDVAGTRGELEAYAVRGRMTVEDADGVTTLESIDADVHLTRVSGDVRVRGSKGAVSLEDISGTLSAATVSGHVTLARVSAAARVETIGGRVHLHAMGRGGRVDIQTHAGDVTVEVTRTAVPRLDLVSRSGTVRGTPPAGERRHGEVVVRTFRGNILLRGLGPQAAPR